MTAFDFCDFILCPFVHVSLYVGVDRFIISGHYPIAWLIFPGGFRYRSSETLSDNRLLRSVQETGSFLAEICTKTRMECFSVKKHNPLFISCNPHYIRFWFST